MCVMYVCTRVSVCAACICLSRYTMHACVVTVVTYKDNIAEAPSANCKAYLLQNVVRLRIIHRRLQRGREFSTLYHEKSLTIEPVPSSKKCIFYFPISMIIHHCHLLKIKYIITEVVMATNFIPSVTMATL